jgi:hypothetical protein
MAAETPIDSVEPAAAHTRRCWRCLQQFPTDEQDTVVRPAEWWVCSACHDALFTR